MASGRPVSARRRLPSYRRVGPAPWVVLVALVGLAVFALTRDGVREGSSGAPFVGGDLHSLVADPTRPDRLFLGGHEAAAVSTDGGRSWTNLETLAGADAMAWAFAGDRVLVGGHPGLYVSDDGGQTFEQRNDGLPATDIHALGAGAGVIVGASPAAGVFASYDDGETWEVLNAEVGRSFMGRILVDPGDPRHLLAPDMRGGAVESLDGGRAWRALGGVAAMWLSWDPTDTDSIVVSGMGSAAVSSDGGATWERLSVPPGTAVVELDPRDGKTLYAALHLDGSAELRVSRDSGRTWRSV